MKKILLLLPERLKITNEILSKVLNYAGYKKNIEVEVISYSNHAPILFIDEFLKLIMKEKANLILIQDKDIFVSEILTNHVISKQLKTEGCKFIDLYYGKSVSDVLESDHIKNLNIAEILENLKKNSEEKNNEYV